MRVVVCTRIFSGLVDSVSNRSWAPKGIPAIYKLVEHLARHGQLDASLVLSAKDARFADSLPGLTRYRDTTLGMWVRVIPYFGSTRGGSRAIRYARFALSESIQTVVAIWTVLRTRARVVYCDRNHLIVATICARLLRKKVVLRLLGVYPDMHALVSDGRSNSLHSRFLRWCYRTGFALVVCTQDGSGGLGFLNRAIHPDTSRLMILNGVDPDPVGEPPTKSPTLDGPALLWVGTMVPSKGIREFVQALVELTRRGAQFSAVVVGDGPLRADVEDLIQQEAPGMQIEFTGLVEHHAARQRMHDCDIYVSVNYYGDLSNTVLEAIAARKAIVTLATDRVDEDVLPGTWCAQIDRDRKVESLTEILADLIGDRALRERLEAGASQAAEELLTWEERIETELGLIAELSQA